MDIQSCGGAVKDFRDLQVWHKAHQLTLTVYRHTTTFPREERYGLTAQLRRSSSSPRIWPKAVAAMGMPNSRASARSRWDRPASWSTTLLLAKDLQLLTAADHTALTEPDHGSEADAHRTAAKADR
jgi:hypothetical protein